MVGGGEGWDGERQREPVLAKHHFPNGKLK